MKNDVWECNGQEFRAGDTVKIVRVEQDFAPDGMGEGVEWENNWVESTGFSDTFAFANMNYGVGKTYEIADIDETGAYFIEDEEHNNRFGYPLSVLFNITYFNNNLKVCPSSVQKEAA